MKKSILLLISIYAISSCSQNSNRIYFSIDPKDFMIIIPVELNDSTTVDMIFDTGAHDNAFYVDSGYMSAYSHLLSDASNLKFRTGSAWDNIRSDCVQYVTPHDVKIGNVKVDYTHLYVTDWEEMMGYTDNYGLFNIPKGDSLHVWEINFENNYLEIHQAAEFNMPKNTILLPMIENTTKIFNVNIPLKVKCSDGDTLTINRTFLIDTGMARDMAIRSPAEELDFFNKKEDAVWTLHGKGYHRYYTVDAVLFDNLKVDSLRIYTFDNPYDVTTKYLVGLNFLKRFNVFFDMKNRQVGLQPLNTFQRIVNPTSMRYYCLTEWASDGEMMLITKVGDYKGNFYKTAGIRAGDKVRKINGNLVKDMPGKDRVEAHLRDTIVYEIIREGESINIVIPIDKSQQNGD